MPEIPLPEFDGEYRRAEIEQPTEVAQALGPGYVFKGRMSGMNYILVAHGKTG